MAKLSPLQTVKEKFTSKASLVDQLVDSLERHESESADEFRTRLLSVSNKKLLRLHAAAARVSSEFSDKKSLVDKIVALKFTGKGDDDYKTKLMTYRVTRLMDLHDVLSKHAKKS